MDKTDQVNVGREHTYSDMFIEISSDEDEEEKDIEVVKQSEPEPILNISGGVYFEGDLSKEHDLIVAHEEVIANDDDKNTIEEGECEEDNDDNDSPYTCSSQHSSEGSLSQECSQESDPGTNS